MAKNKKWEKKREQVKKLTDDMDKAIDSYFTTPEQLKEYLSFMSKFYQYSPRNSALIHGQFRGAKAVGTFKFWQEKGFSVRKGEKSIKILVPNKIPQKFKDENGKWKNIKYATAEQKERIEKGELQRTVSRLYFSLGHVFDVSQTNAKASDLPEIFPNRWMEGNVENYDVIMDSLKKIGKDLNVTIGAPLDELGSAKGAFYYAVDQGETIGHIGLNPRNGELQNVKTMIHELAHAKLHSGDKGLQMTSEEKEFQAEMVAYATASYFGIDTSEYSLKYLADWTQGKELDDKAKLLSEVRETSVGFIHAIEQDLLKEREKAIELESNEFRQEKNMLLINYDGFGSTEHKYVSIHELRVLVSKEKALIPENSNGLFFRANQLLADEDLTPREWSEIFNQMFKERYAVIDEETLKHPSIIIQWSEGFKERNIVLPFKEANEMMERRIHEIEQAKKEANEGQYVPYEKIRYHLLLPNDEGKTDVINMDRLDLGDGHYKSPYEQIVKEKRLTDVQIDKINKSIGLDNIKSKEGEEVVYWYEMTARPISPNCQPKGFVDLDEKQGRHGIVAYDRPLSKKELDDFEMKPYKNKEKRISFNKDNHQSKEGEVSLQR